MARALELARRGRFTTHPNPSVGCVLVRDGAIVGEGWHRRAGEGHAEVNALADAGARAAGATAYVTLEPCNHHGRTPPCTEALRGAGVERVVAAARDPNPHVAGGGLEALRQAGVQVSEGLLRAASERLNREYFKRARTGLPWVRVKVAMSLDGRTAMASGESRWITGEAARGDAQRWRASAGCVLTGIGTVLADDPSLDVRLTPAALGIEGEVRQPLRVVVDTHLRTPPAARLLGLRGHTLILCAPQALSSPAAATLAGAVEPGGSRVSVHGVGRAGGGLDLRAVLASLAADFEVNEVHVEAGARLTGSLLGADLADVLLCYVATDLLGSEARAMAELPLRALAERKRWTLAESRMLGRDLRLTLTPARRADDGD